MVVTEKLNLVAIVNNQDFYNANSYTQELVDGFQVFIDSHPEMKDKTMLITEFLADEFGKEEIKDHSDYLISALFADIAVSKGFDGVLYPSVRMRGRGFNVAITPEAADQKLKLEVAGECIIYKNYEKMAMDNLTNSIVENGRDEFELSDMVSHHAGEDACLRSIDISSIDELTT